MVKRFAVTLFGVLFMLPAFAQVIQLTDLGPMDDITSEPSGMCVLYNTSNGQFEYWVNNDYQYPDNIYSFQLDDIPDLKRTLTVNEFYIDWEDMAKDDNNNIYLGDFGNWVGPNDLQVVKIPDPNTYVGSPPSKDIIEFNFPTSGIADNEAMIHFNGHLYIFSKSVNTNNDPSLNPNFTYVYKIPDTPLAGGGVHTATFHDSKQVIFAGEDITHFKITGADISPDKKKLVLLTYERIWVFSCFDGDDFFGGTTISFQIPFRQYEAVAFLNNHEVVIGKEGANDNPNYNPRAFYIDLYPWIDGSCIDCEKVINGDFDEPNLAWTKFTYGNGQANLNYTNGQAEIDIQTIGTSQWHINMRHKGLILDNGKTYKLRYTAYADDDRLISIIANKRDGSLGYYYKSQQITTVPTTYEHEFTMAEPTDFNSYLSFNVGNYIAHKVYFDNISLEEVSCSCPQNRYFYADIDNVTEHFETGNNIYGSNVINGNSVKYDAANCVELNAGFEVKQGATFEAYNDGCGGN